jgi:estrone sulfotransferase
MMNPKTLDTCKVIYVARNPKDCCVSYFHHHKTMNDGYGYEGSFEEFADIFVKGTVGYGGYFHHLKVSYKIFFFMI